MADLHPNHIHREECIGSISEAVLNILESLPDEFIAYNEEDLVFIINLEDQWLSQQPTSYLYQVFLMLYFINLGELWDLHLDPFETLYIKELSKIDQQVQQRNADPLYYNVIPDTLKTKIKRHEPSKDTFVFVA